MVGVPDSERRRVAQAAEAMVSWNDPDFVGDRHPLEVVVGGLNEMTELALELAAHRRRHPGDDLMTALVEAEIDGEGLTDAEIGAFFTLLAVAGNDTTRHTTSHGAHLLQEHPEERAYVEANPAERLPDAIEEIIRVATPVLTFRRTATQDTELHGQPIAAGEKVVMFYESANRDENAFDDPGTFDVTRSPNHHVGFGGGGPHYCLGASLARTQLRAIFGELLTRVPNLELGEPERLQGSLINGVRKMSYTLD
jgi:cytochrome P450